MLNYKEEKEKIPEHIFKYVENELFSYRTYRAALAELEEDLKEVTEQYPQTSPDTVPGGTEPGDPVNLAAFRAIVIEEKIKWNLSRIRKIEAGLGVLSSEEKQVVEMKYFSDVNYTNEQIIHRLQLNRNCFYRIRNEVIHKFALILSVL